MLSLLRRTLLNKNPTSRLLLKCNQVRNINLQDFNVLQPEEGRCVIKGMEGSFFNIDGKFVQGGVLVLPTFFMQWNVDSYENINPASLAGIELRIPDIDLLLIGVGERLLSKPNDKLASYLASLGVRFEMMGTFQAAGTFNVMQEEGRSVAAALLPLEPVPRQTEKPRPPLSI